MYNDVVDLIREYRVAFPRFGDGVSQESIDQAQRDLGILLPPSFKWWLHNYGGGQIRGDIMYGLEDGNIGRPDIVRLAKENEQNGLYGKERLVFCVGNSSNFCFDTENCDENGEYKVMEHDIDSDEEYCYADSFAAFLERRIKALYGT